MTGVHGDVVVTHAPPDLDVRALRAALLEDPAVAYAAAPAAKRPGVAELGRELLASMGRPGVTHGRKTGERHMLRPLPYWRTDGITDLVILDAQLLAIDGLSTLLDAAAATPLRVWLLLTDPARPYVTAWLTAAHTAATPWSDVVDHWRRRLQPLTGRRRACPTVAAPPWAGPDPVGTLAWTVEPPRCPTHRYPAACLREALRGAHALGQLTPDQARDVARDHYLALSRAGDANGAFAAAVLLGRDHYVPARAALQRIGAPDRTTVADVTPRGGVPAGQQRPSTVEAAALAALRAQDVLAGCPASSPVLCIFGEPSG